MGRVPNWSNSPLGGAVANFYIRSAISFHLAESGKNHRTSQGMGG